MIYFCRIDVEELVNRPVQPKPPVATYIPPRASAAPVLVVVPAQPQGPSMMLCGTSSSQGFIPYIPYYTYIGHYIPMHICTTLPHLLVYIVRILYIAQCVHV
ncbi:hypothetical protein R3I94_021865 [Phoxinus phoxinus]